MNSFDSSEPREQPGKDAILRALIAGQAEEPEAEAAFLCGYLKSRAKLDPNELSAFINDLSNGVSPFHIAGEYQIPGTNCSLLVPRDVMPPGSITAATITVIQQVARRVAPDWIADLGCGIGVLGISALLVSLHSRGVLIDISPPAIAATNSNILRLGLSDRATAVCGDGLSAVLPGSIGMVVANLPFVPTNNVKSLTPRFGRHAPRQAVDGGYDGLDIFRRLLPQIKAALLPDGCVVLQVGLGQKQSVLNLMDEGWATISGWAVNHPNHIVATRVS